MQTEYHHSVSLKMAAPLRTCPKEDYVIHYLISEGEKPKTMRTSKEWHHSSSPKSKKFQMQPSAGKIMLTPLGQTRCILVPLHALGEHSHKCLIFRSFEESSLTCSQIKVTWTFG
jgi:hypothetical protein